MKNSLIALVGIASVALPFGAAHAQSSISGASLQSLNEAHTQIVREAERVCTGLSFGSGVGSNGGSCTFVDIERQIHSSENAELLAFHQQLPSRYRYSSDRSYGEVERYFQ